MGAAEATRVKASLSFGACHERDRGGGVADHLGVLRDGGDASHATADKRARGGDAEEEEGWGGAETDHPSKQKKGGGGRAGGLPIGQRRETATGGQGGGGGGEEKRTQGNSSKQAEAGLGKAGSRNEREARVPPGRLSAYSGLGWRRHRKRKSKPDKQAYNQKTKKKTKSSVQERNTPDSLSLSA